MFTSKCITCGVAITLEPNVSFTAIIQGDESAWSIFTFCDHCPNRDPIEEEPLIIPETPDQSDDEEAPPSDKEDEEEEALLEPSQLKRSKFEEE